MVNFKIVVEDRFPGQVSLNSSHNGIANRTIKEKLTERQLEMFRRTVFGRFVDMDIVANSPLIHHILLREIETDRDESMAFDLNGQIVHFSEEEFLLVTGLWRFPTKVIPTIEVTESIRTKYFPNSNMQDVNLKDFENQYKELEFQNDLDAVKVSLIYYTELGMMGKDKIKGKIDKTLFEDVEDLEYFNSFNWGNILWKRTLSSLQKAMTDRVKIYKEKRKTKKD